MKSCFVPKHIVTRTPRLTLVLKSRLWQRFIFSPEFHILWRALNWNPILLWIDIFIFINQFLQYLQKCKSRLKKEYTDVLLKKIFITLQKAQRTSVLSDWVSWLTVKMKLATLSCRRRRHAVMLLPKWVQAVIKLLPNCR